MYLSKKSRHAGEYQHPVKKCQRSGLVELCAIRVRQRLNIIIVILKRKYPGLKMAISFNVCS